MRFVAACSLVLLVGGASRGARAQAKPEASAPWTPPLYYDLYPETLPYEKGQPVPAGYVVEKTHGTWAIATGSILVGAFFTYGFLAAKNVKAEAFWLVVPVAGPPALLAAQRNHCKPRCFGIEQTALIIDSVGQAAGAAFFIWGLTMEGTKLVRRDLVAPAAGARLAPIVVGSGYGIGAVGSF